MLSSASFELAESEYRHLVGLIATSQRVVNRHQFFVWTQSALQRLLPHEILICITQDGPLGDMRYDYFASTRYFRTEHFAALCDHHAGLWPQLMCMVPRSGWGAIICPSTGADDTRTALSSLRQLIQANEMRNLVAHVQSGPRNPFHSCYAFARVPEPVDERTASIFELTIPLIHATYMRVLNAHAGSACSVAARTSRIVTARQQQVLNLIKDGQSNAEIAKTLNVSPWTVKNHVQMIFNRLDARSRAQAIERARHLGILRAD